MSIQATILFSTFNGARTLPTMLEALCAQTLEQSRFKIVAVDNNSTDETSEILKSYLDKLPLEIHMQPKQGKAHALEMGFQHIEGDLLILTDDDVTPAPEWVDSFLKVAEEHPDYGIFSGLIQPNWEQAPPEWILNWTHLGILYALNDELPEGESKPYHVSGPNSAFRTSLLKGRRYIVDHKLGPNAHVAQFAMGEDTLFARHLADETGAKTWHTHRAVVKHFIPKEYLAEDWILKRAERNGMGIPIVRPFLFTHKPLLCGRPVMTLLKYIVKSALYYPVKWMPRSRRRFQFLWTYFQTKGVLKYPIER